MNAIGGYFGLELQTRPEYHGSAIHLNTGRNALEYILKARNYRKLYLPYYTCHVLLQPIERSGVEYEYYAIDDQMEPQFDYTEVGDDEGFLYTNYFDLKDAFILRLKELVGNLIIDNAQAFYAKPLAKLDTFYSPRKFFGVPDGGYLYTDENLQGALEQDHSWDRCAHLLIRPDDSAERGYPQFVSNDEALDNSSMKQMSKLTRQILSSIDYDAIKKIRRYNYRYLHEALASNNRLSFPLPEDAVPMSYPFIGVEPELRHRLIRQRIYVAQYWPEVLRLRDAGSVEYQFAQDLIPLPVDQRLTQSDLDFIIKTIKNNEHQR